jgi:hypothetical protein
MAAPDVHDQVLRGVHAAAELKETERAFDAVEAAIVKELLQTSPMSTEKILTLHRAAQVVEAVRKALIQTVANGQHGEFALAADAAIAEAGLTRV